MGPRPLAATLLLTHCRTEFLQCDKPTPERSFADPLSYRRCD